MDKRQMDKRTDELTDGWDGMGWDGTGRDGTGRDGTDGQTD